MQKPKRYLLTEKIFTECVRENSDDEDIAACIEDGIYEDSWGYKIFLVHSTPMKTYIVYFNGMEVGMITATSHNAAEKKAQKKMEEVNAKQPSFLPKITNVSVVYTEI